MVLRWTFYRWSQWGIPSETSLQWSLEELQPLISSSLCPVSSVWLARSGSVGIMVCEGPS